LRHIPPSLIFAFEGPEIKTPAHRRAKTFFNPRQLKNASKRNKLKEDE